MKQEYLYKYRAIENLDRDLAMIANDSFFAAGITDLNDDQECFLDGQLFVNSLQILLKMFPGNKHSVENVKMAFEEYVSCRDKVGIFSLSKNPCVGMMWALYASMRRGYCIIYNKDALLKAPSSVYMNDRLMLEVKYSRKAPKQTYETYLKVNSRRNCLAQKKLDGLLRRKLELLLTDLVCKDWFLLLYMELSLARKCQIKTKIKSKILLKIEMFAFISYSVKRMIMVMNMFLTRSLKFRQT